MIRRFGMVHLCLHALTRFAHRICCHAFLAGGLLQCTVAWGRGRV